MRGVEGGRTIRSESLDTRLPKSGTPNLFQGPADADPERHHHNLQCRVDNGLPCGLHCAMKSEIGAKSNRESEKMGGKDFFSEPDQAVTDRANEGLDSLDVSISYSVPEQVALCCRLLAREDHAISLAGQITVKADVPGQYWTTSLDAGFGIATASSILLIDEQMKVIAGQGTPNPAIRFHFWVYARRPDLCALVHTHPPHASALGMRGEPLVAAHMDTAMFYEDCAFLGNWPGVPLANEEGRIISAAMGKANSILLAHHGILTGGASLAHAIYLAIMLERAARLQILAGGADRILPIKAQEAREAHNFLLKRSIIAATVKYWMASVRRSDEDALA